jgi:hypothetical protein
MALDQDRCWTPKRSMREVSTARRVHMRSMCWRVESSARRHLLGSFASHLVRFDVHRELHGFEAGERRTWTIAGHCSGDGAGEGNRTLILSMGNSGPAIERRLRQARILPSVQTVIHPERPTCIRASNPIESPRSVSRRSEAIEHDGSAVDGASSHSSFRSTSDASPQQMLFRCRTCDGCRSTYLLASFA